MIKTEAVGLKKDEAMMVTWDIGKRCNFDCSYCEASRHDLISPLHKYQELLNTFNFINQWTSLYNSKRNTPSHVNINFTGGEPTVNPDFWKLATHIKQNHSNFQLSLTTNGSWPHKKHKEILELFHGVTISYHAEADQRLKDKVIENIRLLKETDIWLQVNVMLHVDYFDECVEVCELLKSWGVKHNPRPIGDGNLARSGWFKDVDGAWRRTSHKYTKDQQKWFFSYIGVPDFSSNKKEGTDFGRSCCGGRCTIGKVNDKWQEVTLVDTHFKKWHCMVDWFFLHIDQHTGIVYHHQTCQALLGEKRGPVGNLKDQTQMIEDLKQRLSQDTVEHIVCPNNRCGCGMCVPKAKQFSDFKLLSKQVTNLSFD